MKSAFRTVACLLLTASCGQPPKAPVTATAVPPRPVYGEGEVVAHYDERVKEDTLNDLRFTVDIVADAMSGQNGVFRLHSAFSGMENRTQFAMPAGGLARPALRREGPGYQLAAGFVTLKDSQFHEVYRITGSDSALRVRRTKGYILR